MRFKKISLYLRGKKSLHHLRPRGMQLTFTIRHSYNTKSDNTKNDRSSTLSRISIIAILIMSPNLYILVCVKSLLYVFNGIFQLIKTISIYYCRFCCENLIINNNYYIDLYLLKYFA